MQKTARSMEREAAHRLPTILADLLDEDAVQLEREAELGSKGHRADFSFVDSQRRRWLIEFKASSRPGLVVDAGRQLQSLISGVDRRDAAIPLLIVPHMSEAGARAAEGERLNWVDLSGNASIRGEDLHVWVRGRPNEFPSRGRPSSPFARKSARIARLLLLDARRSWRQRDLVEVTGLDDSTVSRVVRRLADDSLLEQHDHELRPRDPLLLLDAWADDYRFDRHDIVAGHVSGQGIEVARDLADRLRATSLRHAFTGLAAAWAMDHFARFRLTSVYVDGDPRDAALAVSVRSSDRGANVQLLGPDDVGVFEGERMWDGLNCVSPAQVYLDLLNLPERADEAARHLRAEHFLSRAAA